MKSWYLLFIVIVTGCSQSNRQRRLPARDITISATRKLDSLSSGSGLVFYHQRAFIASDNFNGFVVLDSSNFSWNLYPFRSGEQKHVRLKPDKEDFESATAIKLNGEEMMLALGSGAIEEKRENILLVDLNDPSRFRVIPATPFYGQIKQSLGISTSELNLEGLFCSADSLYLLNRGTNELLSLGRSSFADMINSNVTRLPVLETKRFNLPKFEGFPLSFSGACYYKDNRFLFCATIEKTSNWVEDGAVAGSYIGIASTDGTIIQLSPFTDSSGTKLLQKLETIEISRPEQNGMIECCALADNDNGSSTWFRFQLRVN